jgi:anthranilate phosphoribosyltransferase
MHPAMKHVAAVRKRLGIRTIFNILGPLANPAGACYQLLGAGRPELRPLLAGAMAKLVAAGGSPAKNATGKSPVATYRTLVVSGEDGLGDVTLSGTTHVTEVVAEAINSIADSSDSIRNPKSKIRNLPTFRHFTWQPEDFGLTRQPLTALSIDSPQASAALIRNILAGQPGPARDIVILNAAAGLIAAGRTNVPKQAASIASAAIDSSSAADLLTRLAARSHAPA